MVVLLIRPTGLLKGRRVKRWFPVGARGARGGPALYPLQATGYGVRVMLQLFMWIALAQSWNLISGLTGYVSFGHVVFFGTGAYASSILIVALGWTWPLACLGGGVVAAGLAFLIGWPCLRLKGPYFAIATLGLNEVMRVVVSYYEGLTGGGNGLSLPTLHASVEIYYAMGLVAAAVTAVAYVIVTSRFGLRLMTIREDEVAAEAMGIDTFRYKLYAFLLSAAAPGHRGRPLRARPGLHRAPLGVPPDHDDHHDRDGAVRRQGDDLGAGARRRGALRVPGDGVGPLHLPSPAPLRRDHRGGGAPRCPAGSWACSSRSTTCRGRSSGLAGPMAPILEIRSVVKRFGGVAAVDGVSLALEPGRIYGLIGPNGSGKTTLFNCITGVGPGRRGRDPLQGRRIDGLKPHQIFHLGMGRTFQVIRVFPELTALENLLVVTTAALRGGAAPCPELLALVKLERLAGEFAGNLSYGQQKLVEFIRVLMTDPELILLDEPAAGVNRTLLNELLDAVRRLRDRARRCCSSSTT